MSGIYSKMQFDKYIIEEIVFKIVGDIDKEGPFQYDNIIDATAVHEDDNDFLRLSYTISEKPEDFPFEIRIVIVGYFSFDGDVSNEEKEVLLKFNGIAILLPYLRSAMTQITTMTGVGPLYLPLVNVQHLMERMRSEPQK